jgi:hypothetical protein
VVDALSNAPRGRARSALLVIIAALAALLFSLMPGTAHAQGLSVSTQLCDQSGCGLNTAAPGQMVWYQVTITDPTPPASVNLLDVPGPTTGFILVNAACGPTAGNVSVVQWSGAPGAINGISLQPAGQAVCLLYGYFDGTQPGGVNTVTVTDPASHDQANDSINTLVTLGTPLPTDLAITKTVNVPTIDITYGPQIVDYTIEVENVGQKDVFLGPFLRIQDRMKLISTSVVLHAQFVSATCTVVPASGSPLSDCVSNVPTQPGTALPKLLIGSIGYDDFAYWSYPSGNPGLLRVGHKMVLKVQVRVSAVPGANCIMGGDGFINEAQIRLTLPGTSTTLAEQPAGTSAANNTATVLLNVITGQTQVNSACNLPFLPASPVIKITKVQIVPLPSANAPWPGTITYRLTVKNISANMWLKKIKVGDFVRVPIGTPPFTAQWVSHNCLPPVCNPWGQTTHFMSGYGVTSQVWNATLFNASGAGATGLGPNQSVNIILRLRYSNPRCDSYTGPPWEPVDNIGAVLGWDQFDPSSNTTVTVTQGVASLTTTRMKPVPPCPLVVKKWPTVPPPAFPPPHVPFGQSYGYTVEYSNPASTNQTFQVGTLFDAARYVPVPSNAPPYAVQLQVAFNYTCTPSGGLSGGFPTMGSGNIAIVATALAQQGVRILQNSGPVDFSPGAKLTCLVDVKVSPPAPNDPYCSTADLQNVALLDMSAHYNPNMFPSPSGGPNMMASVRTPLLRCFNYVVNKAASQPWVGQGAGPLNWTLSVTNAGPPISPANAVTVIGDAFAPAPSALTATPPVCTPATPACTFVWQPPPPNPGVGLLPTNFATGQTVSVNFTVPNTPGSPAALGQNCNKASAGFLLPNTPWLGYWKNPSTLATTPKCIQVVKVGPVTVNKQVVNLSGLAVSGSYAIQLSCTFPGLAVPVANFSLAAGVGHTVPNIPAGSQCTVTENPPPAPPPGTRSCPFPVWTTSYAPSQTFTTPANGAAASATVVNTLKCMPMGGIIIKKNTVSPFPQTPFDFIVNCTPNGPSNLLVTVPANGSGGVANIPAPATCTLTEQPHAAPSSCVWTPTYSPANPFAVPPNVTTVASVTNNLVCGGPLDLTVLFRKRVEINGGPPQSPGVLGAGALATFTVTVTCGSNPPVQVVLNAANNFEAMHGQLPGGTTCTFQEAQPPNLGACTWAGTHYPQGQSVTISGGQIVREIRNRYICTNS